MYRGPMLPLPWRIAIDVVYLLIVFFIQRYWFVRAWRLIERVGQAAVRNSLRIIWIAAASALVVTILDGVFGHFMPRTGAPAVILLLSRLWLSVSFLALAAVGLTGAFNWISKSVLAAAAPANHENLDRGRRAFFRKAAYLAGGLPFVAAAYGFFEERLSYRIMKVEIPVANLPAGLDGMRIVQLSDIHAGDFMPQKEIRRAVDMANDLGADLAVVTGDFISVAHDPLEECIAELGRLRAPLGVWGCNGNHEIYAGFEARAQQLFESFRMRLLRQENVELDWRGGKFNLIGVDYQRERLGAGKKAPMLRDMEPLVRKDMPNILLSHNPNSFRRAAELGIELSLAGHTHGGQVQVEIVDHSFSPAQFMTDFIAGLYRLPLGASSGAGSPAAGEDDASGKQAALYVNRGLGTIGMPVRLGVPPEITLITLRTAG
ncbi:MAG: metallophosphoesterase [Candidatus Acidiferrales bacterium]